MAKLARPRRRGTARRVPDLRRKSKGDPYDVPDDSPEKPRAKSTVGTRRRKRPMVEANDFTNAPVAGIREQATKGRANEEVPYYACDISPMETRENIDNVQAPEIVISRQSSASLQDQTEAEKEASQESEATPPGTQASSARESSKETDVDIGRPQEENRESIVNEEGVGNDGEQLVVGDELPQPVRVDAKSDDHQSSSAGEDSDSTVHTNYQSGEEDQQEPTNPTSAHPGPEQRKELLGQDILWKHVRDAIRANSNEKLIDKTIITKRFKKFIKIVREAKQIHANIASQIKNGQEGTDALLGEAKRCLDRIDDQVRDLPQEKPTEEAKQMVQDAYMNAVPHLIDLLRSAMSCRVLKPPKRAYSLEGIKEVVRLQGIILRLCMKVRSWRVKPATDRPITRNIIFRVFPYLKHINKAFLLELEVEERREQFQRHKARAAAIEEQREVSRNRASEQRESSTERCNRMLENSMAAERRRVLPRPLLARQDQRYGLGIRQTRNPPMLGPIWTYEEDIALKYELLTNAKASKLPPQERYLEILNHELLQNKLPEHIQERAKYHKPFLAQACMDKDGKVHPAIKSIQ
ncbi:MAG: hypothetical protein Q9163_004660 [Psora crenata]